MELTTTWKEEGRQEGRQTTTFSLTLRLLTRRFGPLTAEVEGQIRALSVGQLEQLFDAAYEFGTVADVQAWLAANPPVAPNADK